MTYGLPESVDIDGVEYKIRTDYRVIMDIFEALNDPEITDNERAYLALMVFYPDYDVIPQTSYRTAIEKLFWFIRGGSDEEKAKQRPKKLVDWEQDYQLIIAPVNRIIGREVRSLSYLHWWTFLAAYMEIGECTFSQVVQIRSKLANGKRLSKEEHEWYNNNRDIVDIKTKYTESENNLLSMWGGDSK